MSEWQKRLQGCYIIAWSLDDVVICLSGPLNVEHSPNQRVTRSSIKSFSFSDLSGSEVRDGHQVIVTNNLRVCFTRVLCDVIHINWSLNEDLNLSSNPVFSGDFLVICIRSQVCTSSEIHHKRSSRRALSFHLNLFIAAIRYLHFDWENHSFTHSPPMSS